ncbi:MAG: DUF554 domain-containing protein [Clostridiales bacterium]|nr:DUF554 domain-containing protein [Candidatus Equinaster intestinalis]
MDVFSKIFLSGAAVNLYLIVIGGLIGTFFKKGIPERIKNALFIGMGLCVFLIGVDGILDKGAKILVVIISMGLGAVIGELLDLDKQVNRLGKWFEEKFSRGGKTGSFAEGFVTSTLLFCVGAMLIVGSIESGVSGDNSTLYSKSVIDGISAAALASTFGIGVMFSAVPVVVLEGGLTLLATVIGPYLSNDIVTQMSVIGSLLIVAISLNMLGITKIKVMNFVPAIFIPILLCQFM